MSSKIAEVSDLYIDEIHVKNKEAYEKFIALSNCAFINQSRFYQTEKVDIRIDFFSNNFTIKNQTAPLKIKEKFHVLARNFIVKSLYRKMVRARFLAINQKLIASNTIDNIVLERRKAEIVEMFSKFFSINEVHRAVNVDFGIEISLRSLDLFRKANIDEIVERQEEYKKDFSSIRLSHKKSRLEELSWLYDQIKQKYRINDKNEYVKQLQTLLEQIRKEVEGDIVRIEGNLELSIQHTLNLHIQQEIIRYMPISEIVIMRVANKLGKNPLQLLSKLQKSYYAKFAGFQDTGEDLNTMKPEYPSDFIYNLDKLVENYNKDRENVIAKEKVLDAVMVVPDERKKSAKDILDGIKEKISKEKKKITIQKK